jgi:DNA-binding response OmpR family regulator
VFAVGNILVVEDEPAIAAAVAARLESEGHVVTVCHDGADAACRRAPVIDDQTITFNLGRHRAADAVTRVCG